MKKILLFALFIPMLVCCVNNENTKNSSGTDSLDLSCDTIKVMTGVVGEGTSMHSLELIAEKDSIYNFVYESTVLGGLIVGDEVAVEYNYSDGMMTALNIVNLSSLRHLWLVENTQGKQHLELDKNGIAASYGMDDVYDHWQLESEHLILKCGTVADTFEISLLTDDSLYLTNKTTSLKMKKEN